MYQSHCTLVLFCTSPMRLGQKGVWDRWLTSIPLCPCPNVHESYFVPVTWEWDRRGWDTEGWPPSLCTSPMRLGQKGTETDGWPPSLHVPVPLYTSPIVYQSHETGTHRDWDTEGWPPSNVSLSHCQSGLLGSTSSFSSVFSEIKLTLTLTLMLTLTLT